MTDDTPLPEVADEEHRSARGTADAPLIARVRAGDSDAFGELYDRWFDRVHDLAYRILWDREAAADVAQDAFLSAWRNLDRLEDPHAFGGWLLRIARNGALNRKRKEDRARPVDEAQLAVIERVQIRPEDRLGSVDDPAHVAEDAELVALLWDSADALGERDREVLDLHLRHGLAPAEIADVVGLNRNAANQLVHRVRQRLTGAVEARVLWRGGAPACAHLRAELEAEAVDAFGPEAVRLAVKHAANCIACEERRRSQLSPAQMFSALPILSLPALKAKAAAALSAEGVPMQGSTSVSDPSTSAGDRARRGRIRRLTIGAGTVAAIVAAVIAFGASRAGDNSTVLSDDELASLGTPTSTNDVGTGDTPTTTASTSSTTTTTVPASTTTAPPAAGNAGGGGGAVAPPVTAAPNTTTTAPGRTTTTVAPATTTTTVPPPLLGVTLVPASKREYYPMGSAGANAPKLGWSVAGAPPGSTANMHGPNVDVSTMQGQVAVCPVAASGSICAAPRGKYTYTLDLKNANGTVIASRRVTLTITGPNDLTL